MQKLIIKYSLICATIWTLVIFILCSTPGKYVPTAHWLNLISFDKFVHAAMYFILSSLWMSCIISNYFATPSKIAIVLFLCVLYGGVLEIMQSKLFSQRSGDWFDFIANSIGCIIAYMVFKNKKLFKERNID